MTYPNYPQQNPQPWSAPQPGVIPLQPLTMGNMFAGSFTTLWRNWQPLVLPPFVLTAIFATIQQVFTASATNLVVSANGRPDPTQVFSAMGQLLGADLLAAVLALITSAVTYSVGTVVTARAVLGRRTSFVQAFRAIGDRWAPLLGMLLMVAVITAGCVVLPVLVAFALGTFSTGLGVIVGVLGGITGVCFALYYGISFSFGAPALVLEPQPVFGALRRSRWLVSGDWWRVFGVLLVGGLIVAAASIALQIPVTALRFATTPANVMLATPQQMLAHPSPVVTVLSVLIGALLSAFGTPFMVGVTVLMYHDYRIRKENFHQTLYALAQEPDTL